MGRRTARTVRECGEPMTDGTDGVAVDRSSLNEADLSFFAEFDAMVARRLRQQRWIAWAAIAAFVVVERTLTLTF
jgi:hypothetical protein